MHHKGTAMPVFRGSLKENSSDTSQPAGAQLDVPPVLSVMVGAERGPQLSDTLAQMGHEFKHGGGQTLVDEVAGQSALTRHKKGVLIGYFCHISIFSSPIIYFIFIYIYAFLFIFTRMFHF